MPESGSCWNWPTSGLSRGLPDCRKRKGKIYGSVICQAGHSKFGPAVNIELIGMIIIFVAIAVIVIKAG
jgi:hypothetical protein